MMQRVPNTPETATVPADGQEPSGCRHYWVIQPATGPVSQGLCQTCDQTREFKNYVEASTWGDDRSAGRPKRGVASPAILDEEEPGFLEEGEAA